MWTDWLTGQRWSLITLINALFTFYSFKHLNSCVLWAGEAEPPLHHWAVLAFGRRHLSYISYSLRWILSLGDKWKTETERQRDTDNGPLGSFKSQDAEADGSRWQQRQVIRWQMPRDTNPALECFFHFQNHNCATSRATSAGREIPEATWIPLQRVSQDNFPQITCYLNLTARLDYKP